MRETVTTDGTVTSVLDFIYDENRQAVCHGQSMQVQEKLYMTLRPFILRTIVEEGV